MALRSLGALTRAFLVLFLAVTVLAGLAINSATQNTVRHLVDERITTASADLAPDDHPPGLETLRRGIAQRQSERETADLGYLVHDRTGRQLAGNVRLGAAPVPGYMTLDRSHGIGGLTMGRAYTRDLGNGLRLTVIAETEPIDHSNAARLRIFLLGFGGLIAVMACGLLLFQRTVERRTGEMRQTVGAIIEGDLSRRLPLAGDGGEFDRQAMAFNRMLDRIYGLMGEIRNVSNDISHELRTPLARMRNQLSLLARRDDAAPIRGELDDAIEQADDLLAMFGAMLRIADIESGARRAGFALLRLDALVREVAETLDAVAGDTDHVLTVAACAETEIVGDRQLLIQMLMTLAENGLKHTPTGTTLILGVARRPGEAELVIADNGPGIAAEQRALVLRRFGRLERSRGTGGHGLGMALADAIARLHRGTLVLEDAGPGLRIVITLPLA